MCNCLEKIRSNIMKNDGGNYVRIDCSTIAITENGKVVRENVTGQRIEIGYKHTRRDGKEIQKERKSFVTHDYCPFCGEKYSKK